jgi:predicted nucleic acid-binding protein
VGGNLVLNLKDKHVILDNNIIFDFGSLDDFDLLNKIFVDSFVVISPNVKEEIKESINIKKLRFELAVYTTASDYATHFRLKRTHRGLTDEDISCLVLAKKYEGICASNDRLIRKVALQEGIGIIGSIGLLKCAIRKGIVTHKQAVDILLWMKEKGAFIDTKLLDDFRQRR